MAQGGWYQTAEAWFRVIIIYDLPRGCFQGRHWMLLYEVSGGTLEANTNGNPIIDDDMTVYGDANWVGVGYAVSAHSATRLVLSSQLM